MCEIVCNWGRWLILLNLSNEWVAKGVAFYINELTLQHTFNFQCNLEMIEYSTILTIFLSARLLGSLVYSQHVRLSNYLPHHALGICFFFQLHWKDERNYKTEKKNM